ncbi:hypothetical protein [Pseudohongiella spirulinae]|uniref:Copper type II ascorbate-dependent monooxygenase C-terminal domain-containing protein n=1 Tax=Pseudohongiella spirulinae TaxID=1249552 RepID=A0A0S2KB08_9GAMM|nr:hypothetical protein [Pseudohongiella spirulinae]ALO45349.1 hypothetical protein PS2015_669 [Pseudohongiella spirulinae]
MKKTTLTAAMLLTAGWMVGAQAGVDPLTQIEAPSSEWIYNGTEPDYIVDVPSFTVPATGVIDYIDSVIPLEFGEEKWVKAVQFIPGDKRVLHHLLSYVVADTEKSEGMIDEAVNDPRREFLEGYAPGKEYATEFPAGTGIKVPEGSALRMSIHYTSFGQESVDNTRVGLWFYDEGQEPDLEYHTYSVSPGNRTENIIIPPGAMEHEMAATHVFDKDIVLHGFRAHMHYRGKSMAARVIYPDNTQEKIINIPDYNFAWQPTYRMDEPMVIPAGSRVVVEGLFDNSEYNPGNPDPTVPALGGLQSWEEMFIGYFSYTDLP